MWHDAGGRWEGRARDGVAGEAARLLASQASPPLSQLIRDVNKFSNNVMTRQLFLTLGAEVGGHGSHAAARRAIVDWLALRGIADDGFVIENGAGLSRTARIRPAMLADVLADAWRDPVMPEFVASLPIAGVDGTAARRTGARGAAHIKTGMLRDVRAIAGYVHAASGRRYAVVAIVNHTNAPAVQTAHDALLDWLHHNG
jgi:serine-type D-Ala-D-Ala carboxypeptidase/endopeptidase (penicillin-binding protein 4)